MLDKLFKKPLYYFESVTYAAEHYLNDVRKTSHVSDVCKGKRIHAYGYKWRYATEEENNKYNFKTTPIES
jgi:hypothetical protein